MIQQITTQQPTLQSQQLEDKNPGFPGKAQSMFFCFRFYCPDLDEPLPTAHPRVRVSGLPGLGF